jgi:hypothetical protein
VRSSPESTEPSSWLYGNAERIAGLAQGRGLSVSEQLLQLFCGSLSPDDYVESPVRARPRAAPTCPRAAPQCESSVVAVLDLVDRDCDVTRAGSAAQRRCCG